MKAQDSSFNFRLIDSNLKLFCKKNVSFFWNKNKKQNNNNRLKMQIIQVYNYQKINSHNQIIQYKMSNQKKEQLLATSLPSEQINNQPKNAFFSYILILISTFTWVSGFIYPNEHKMQPSQTNALKGYILIIITYTVCKWNGYSLLFPTRKDFIFLVVRNVIFIIHDFATAFVQFRLPLPIVHNINNMMSVTVIIIQNIIENKQLSVSQKKSAGMILLGAIFITNYRFLEPLLRPDYTFSSQFQNYGQMSKIAIFQWSLIYLGFTILSSFAIYMSSFIKMNVYQINFHYSIKLILMNFFAYIFSHQKSLIQTLLYAIPLSSLVFALGELAFAASILYAKNIGVTLLLGSFTIVVSYTWSMFRYQQEVSIISLIGSLLIVTGIAKIFLNL